MLQSGPTVASLPSFHTVQSLLAVHEYRAAGEEHCEQGNERVCAKPLMPDVVMSWHPKCIRTIAAM